MSNPDIINPVFARGLKTLRCLTWNQVGIELARQQFRDIPFTGNAVQHAVLNFEKFRSEDEE